MGVPIFFVISGFIIPYALDSSGYRVTEYGRFLLKRVIRLDPPYLVAILIAIVVGYIGSAVPGHRGEPFHVSLLQIGLHLGYINVLFHEPWINPVFWTLAIEAQYYLAMGFLFFLIRSRSLRTRISTFAGLGILAFLLPSQAFLPHWFFVFMIGIAGYQFRRGILGRTQLFLWLLLLGFGVGFTENLRTALCCVVTALIICLYNANIAWPLLFFGEISFSLYLVHASVGSRLIFLSIRYIHSFPGQLFVLALAFVSSIGVAYLLYRFVERPAREMSGRIRYRSRSIALATPPH